MILGLGVSLTMKVAQMNNRLPFKQGMPSIIGSGLLMIGGGWLVVNFYRFGPGATGKLFGLSYLGIALVAAGGYWLLFSLVRLVR